MIDCNANLLAAVYADYFMPVGGDRYVIISYWTTDIKRIRFTNRVRAKVAFHSRSLGRKGFG